LYVTVADSLARHRQIAGAAEVAFEVKQCRPAVVLALRSPNRERGFVGGQITESDMSVASG
jgi:hypothetical protein